MATSYELVSGVLRYMQPVDCCGPDSADHELTIEVCDAVAVPHLVLSTQRWAIDTPQE